MSIAQATRDLRSGLATPSELALMHHGTAVTAMQERIMSENAHEDDGLMWAVMGHLVWEVCDRRTSNNTVRWNRLISGLQHMYSNPWNFEVHLNGFRRIVELRGGPKRLGWQGYPASRLAS